MQRVDRGEWAGWWGSTAGSPRTSCPRGHHGALGSSTCPLWLVCRSREDPAWRGGFPEQRCCPQRDTSILRPDSEKGVTYRSGTQGHR